MRKYLGRTSAGLTGLDTPDGDFVAINPATGNYEGVGAREACHAKMRDISESAAEACATRAGFPKAFAQEASMDPLYLLLIVLVVVVIVSLVR